MLAKRAGENTGERENTDLHIFTKSMNAIYLFICIYMYISRERERERGGHMCIFIYTCQQRERERGIYRYKYDIDRNAKAIVDGEDGRPMCQAQKDVREIDEASECLAGQLWIHEKV